EVSGRRRADSSSIESEAYCLSVSEKKREEYYRAIPQNCPALYLSGSAGLRVRLCVGLSCPLIPFFRQRAGLALEQDPRCGALEIIILAVFQRPHEGRKSYQAKPDRNRDKEREVDHSAASPSNSRAPWCAGSRSLRPLWPRRRAFATTTTHHADIATAATSGVTSPRMPSGIATRL